MVRKRVFEEGAMTATQRRSRSDTMRRERGEKRFTGWLDVPAHDALRYMLTLRGETGEHGDIQRVVNVALVYLAQANGMPAPDPKPEEIDAPT